MSVQSYPQFEQQRNNSFFELSAGTIDHYDFFNIDNSRQHKEFDGGKSFRKRRDDTNAIINKLYEATLMRRPGEREVIRIGGRKNKNEILGLTNARFVKEKHLKGVKFSRDVELVRGIHTNVKNGEFVLVLRTDGRIVTMSDEVECHLNKSMRSLYTQCMNIFECLDQTDGKKLQSIFDKSNDLNNQEHQLICTLRLPKGKRPSRTREDIKTISMAGHFYSCHNSTYDKLFIARCEALVSRTANGTSSSQVPSVNSNVMKLTLNDDMTISMISSNVKDILDYSRNEIIGYWFGRLLATEDLEKFQTIHHGQLQKPASVRDIFDVYTRNGENRLTFLCQIRPTRERRSKSIKYSIIAQLIDPSMRHEYRNYVLSEVESNQTGTKIDEINLVSPSAPKTSEDNIVAGSPSLDMGILMPEHANSNESFRQQQLSPVTRSLSEGVTPFTFDVESPKLFDYEYSQCSKRSIFDFGEKNRYDDMYIKYQLEQEIASIDALVGEY